jgi:hypothetical protein
MKAIAPVEAVDRQQACGRAASSKIRCSIHFEVDRETRRGRFAAGPT